MSSSCDLLRQKGRRILQFISYNEPSYFTSCLYVYILLSFVINLHMISSLILDTNDNYNNNKINDTIKVVLIFIICQLN